ncbi:MAG: hypothetical protein SGPRY_008724 [Prymnesium sp.]
MVADSRSTITRSTDYRDLKDSRKFVQWSADLHRIVRQHTTPHFIGSVRPGDALSADEPEGGIFRPSTRAKVRVLEGTHASHGDVVAQQDLWDQWNVALFDITSASVDLSKSQLALVSTRFEKTCDGQGLLAWVLSHADSQKQSAQLRLRATVEGIEIPPTASAADIDEQLEIVENLWPKIRAFDQSSARRAVEFVLSEFHQSIAR